MSSLSNILKDVQEKTKKTKKSNKDIGVDHGYRDKKALDNQEVVTPPELLRSIYKHLRPQDMHGDILDPCVGPGAMAIPFIKFAKTLTVCDIQEMHVENFKKIYKEKKEIYDKFD